MKTRNVVMTAAAMIVASAFTFAGEPTSKVVVLNQGSAEIFKVIYEGTTVGKVTLKVYDKSGNQLLAESTTGLSKFMRSVNFAGMEPGEYSIQISDATGTHTEKVNYKITNKKVESDDNFVVNNESSIKAVHITKLQGEGKYLMSISTEGSKKINVRIYDETANLLHNENVTVNGSMGLVYNLKQVQGQPSFLVSDSQGNKQIIK